MGYNTVYNLEWQGDQPDIDQVAAFLALTNPDLSDQRALALFTQVEDRDREIIFWKDILEGADETTWYTHQADTARVSRAWPETIFTLHLNGDDSTDFQIQYHRDGLVQAAPGTIVYPPFHPDLLRAPEESPGHHPDPQTFIYRGILFRKSLNGYYAAPFLPNRNRTSPGPSFPNTPRPTPSKPSTNSSANSRTTQLTRSKPQRPGPSTPSGTPQTKSRTRRCSKNSRIGSSRSSQLQSQPDQTSTAANPLE